MSVNKNSKDEIEFCVTVKNKVKQEEKFIIIITMEVKKVL